MTANFFASFYSYLRINTFYLPKRLKGVVSAIRVQ